MDRKRLYYLVHDADHADRIAKALKQFDVHYDNYHLLSKDEDSINRRNLHGASILESSDLVHMGERGALIGGVVGFLFALMLVIIDPFQGQMGFGGFLAAFIIITCFGAWSGGIGGISSRNYKTRKFQKAIDNGHYLMLIDVLETKEKSIRQYMRKQFKNAHFAGTDKTATNPFDGLPFWKTLQS